MCTGTGTGTGTDTGGRDGRYVGSVGWLDWIGLDWGLVAGANEWGMEGVECWGLEDNVWGKGLLKCWLFVVVCCYNRCQTRQVCDGREGVSIGGGVGGGMGEYGEWGMENLVTWQLIF